MKNKITVLIDFSLPSENILLYALEFAHMHKKNVEVIFYQNPMLDVEGFLKFDLRKQFVKKQIDKCGIDDLTVNIIMYPDMKKNGILENYWHSDDTLIIGLQKKIELEKLYNNSNLFDRLNCPVIVVSKFTKRDPINEILFVSDFETAEQTLLQIWNNYSAHYIGISIHIIFKVIHGGESIEIQDIFNKIFEDGDPDLSFKLSIFEEVAFDEKLIAYIKDNNIEMAISA